MGEYFAKTFTFSASRAVIRSMVRSNLSPAEWDVSAPAAIAPNDSTRRSKTKRHFMNQISFYLRQRKDDVKGGGIVHKLAIAPRGSKADLARGGHCTLGQPPSHPL